MKGARGVPDKLKGKSRDFFYWQLRDDPSIDRS
jgi:hypothetical protein